MERDDLLARINLGDLLIELAGDKQRTYGERGQLWPCPAPGHDQTGASPPVSITADPKGYDVWCCQVCQNGTGNLGGTAIDALMVAKSLDVKAAFAELQQRAGLPPVGGRGSGGSEGKRVNASTGCTVEQYADFKGLPVEFLKSLGISDYKDSRFSERVLRTPYRDEDGNEPAVRIRKELLKREDGSDERFLWRKGSKPGLYALWRLEQARAAGQVVLVEGESCAQTLWHHDIPALGIPGAGVWRDDRDVTHFEGIERIYVVVEPDHGGEVVLGWLSKSKLRDRAWLVEVEGGDVSALYLDDREKFRQRFVAALEAAEPWRVRAAREEDAERRELGEQCANLAAEPRILDRFEKDLRDSGVEGEQNLAKLLYLSTTSRVLDRIVSVGVKGPSSAGKTFVVERTLDFFPHLGLLRAHGNVRARARLPR